MGIRLRHLIFGALALGTLGVGLGAPAAAISKGGDVQVAKTGIFVSGDFPDGFARTAATPSSSAENIKLAKGVSGRTSRSRSSPVRNPKRRRRTSLTIRVR